MPTTQSEDPNERVDHPRHYNQHSSGIECIELIEHLPCNLGNAVKYLWRCGLKTTETPLRDLKSALWYHQREVERIRVFEIHGSIGMSGAKTDTVWRAHARRIVDIEYRLSSDEFGIGRTCQLGVLGAYLNELLNGRQEAMSAMINEAIFVLEDSR